MTKKIAEKQKRKREENYTVYIVQCCDDTLYTGITTDIKRRLSEHNSDQLGAKYTRYRRPVKIVYTKNIKTYSEALKTEASIKRMNRSEKIRLIGT